MKVHHRVDSVQACRPWMALPVSILLCLRMQHAASKMGMSAERGSTAAHNHYNKTHWPSGRLGLCAETNLTCGRGGCEAGQRAGNLDDWCTDTLLTRVITDRLPARGVTPTQAKQQTFCTTLSHNGASTSSNIARVEKTDQSISGQSSL
jgi:hypothetical protein